MVQKVFYVRSSEERQAPAAQEEELESDRSYRPHRLSINSFSFLRFFQAEFTQQWCPRSTPRSDRWQWSGTSEARRKARRSSWTCWFPSTLSSSRTARSTWLHRRQHQRQWTCNEWVAENWLFRMTRRVICVEGTMCSRKMNSAWLKPFASSRRPRFCVRRSDELSAVYIVAIGSIDMDFFTSSLLNFPAPQILDTLESGSSARPLNQRLLKAVKNFLNVEQAFVRAKSRKQKFRSVIRISFREGDSKFQFHVFDIHKLLHWWTQSEEGRRRRANPVRNVCCATHKINPFPFSKLRKSLKRIRRSHHSTTMPIWMSKRIPWLTSNRNRKTINPLQWRLSRGTPCQSSRAELQRDR